MSKKYVPCPFCGIGCKFELESKRPASEACARIYGAIQYFSKNSVDRPLLLEGDVLHPIKWEEAIEITIEWITSNKTYFVGSAEDTNESAFLLNLIARSLGSNDVDHCGRVCHSASVMAYREIFGVPTTNFSLDREIKGEVFIIGSDVSVTYPVFWYKILKEAKDVVVIDSWTSFTMSRVKHRFLIPPGPGYLALSELLYSITYKREVPQWVYDWLNEELVNQLKDLWESAEKPILVHGMGVTHSGYGYSALLRLMQAFLKKGGLIATLRGKVNVQGAGDMGLVPDLPSYFGALENEFGIKIPSDKGADLVEAFKRSYPVYMIHCQNVVASLPNSDAVAHKLLRSKVIQLTPKFTETSVFADLIIPTTPLIYSSGTVTSGDGKVQAFEVDVNASFEFFKKLLEYFDIRVSSVREVTRTAFETIPYYRTIDVDSLYSGNDQYIRKPASWREVRPPEVRIFKEHEDEGYWLYTTRDPALWTTKGADEILERNSMKRGFYLNPEELIGCKRVEICSPYTGACVRGDVIHDHKVPKGLVVAFFNHVGLKLNSLIPFEPRDEYSGTPIYKATKVKVECVSN